MTSGTLKGGLLAAAAAAGACRRRRRSRRTSSACLITKTDTNPFFVKMKEGAQAKADELGMKLTALAGREEGDNEGQVAAIESCIADGVNGILLVPTDSAAIVDTVKAARDAGILVIALDTPLDPIDAADATFATDNFKAGELIGAWAKAHARRQGGGRQDRLSRPSSRLSRPSTCCATRASCRASASISAIPKKIGDETDARNVCHDVTSGNAAGRPPGDGELPAEGSGHQRRLHASTSRPRAGGYEALKAVGKEKDVLIVSVDGGCPGVKNVAEGVHRRHLAAVSAADGVDGHRGDQEVRRHRREAGDPRGQGLRRHRRGAGDRQAGRRRRLDRHQDRPGEVLGLIASAGLSARGRPDRAAPVPKQAGANSLGQR